MAPIAMIFGTLLTVLGIGLYVATGMDSPTALIPAFFGVALIVLGLLAHSGTEKMRKHMMHGAAALGALGFLLAAGRAVMVLARGETFNLAVGGLLAMAALCGIFVALCAKSFVDVRRSRREGNSPL